jgi:serine protease inhibitor
MNEQGARAESAAAVAMKRSRPVGEWVTIDKPFLLWIEKRGEVVFGGWFEEGCWADPGSLDS